MAKIDYSNFAFPKKGKVKDKKVLKNVKREYCFLCGQTGTDISAHHIIPRSFRRLDIEENLVPLCEFSKDGPGCHKLMDSPDWMFYTAQILKKLPKSRIDILREESKEWSFWEFWDKQ